MLINDLLFIFFNFLHKMSIIKLYFMRINWVILQFREIMTVLIYIQVIFSHLDLKRSWLWLMITFAKIFWTFYWIIYMFLTGIILVLCLWNSSYGHWSPLRLFWGIMWLVGISSSSLRYNWHLYIHLITPLWLCFSFLCSFFLSFNLFLIIIFTYSNF